MGLSDVQVLVVPGLHGSAPAHWQSRWERLYPAFQRVHQAHWDQPELARWSDRLAQSLQQAQADGARPAVIVAHSFGCLTTVHRAAQPDTRIAAALLVAPADPDKFNVAAQVAHALPCPALVVASTDDPWMRADRARHWAGVWGADFLDIGARGHINADSGLGDWEAGQALLLGLVNGLGMGLGLDLGLGLGLARPA